MIFVEPFYKITIIIPIATNQGGTYYLETFLIKFIFQAVPESSGLAAMAMAVAGVTLSWQKVVAVGIAQAISALLIRMLPLSFGIHSVILIFLLVVFLRIATKVDLSLLFRGAFTGFVLLFVAETVFLQAGLFLTKWTIEYVMSHTWIMVLLGLPQAIVLMAIALFIDYRRRRQKALDAAGKSGIPAVHGK